MGRRGWLVCLVVTGCGRLDFDPLSDAGGGSGSDGSDGSGFAGLCGFGQVTLVQSGIAADDTMAATLPPALASGSSTGPMVRMVSPSTDQAARSFPCASTPIPRIAYGLTGCPQTTGSAVADMLGACSAPGCFTRW